MKIIGLLLVVFFSSTTFAEDSWHQFAKLVVQKNQCGDESRFQSLFDVSIKGIFKGADDFESISEMNEKSFFNCPKQFIVALSKLSKKDQDKVLKEFGVVTDPHSIRAELEKLKDDKNVWPYIKENMQGYLELP